MKKRFIELYMDLLRARPAAGVEFDLNSGSIIDVGADMRVYADSRCLVMEIAGNQECECYVSFRINGEEYVAFSGEEILEEEGNIIIAQMEKRLAEWHEDWRGSGMCSCDARHITVTGQFGDFWADEEPYENGVVEDISEEDEALVDKLSLYVSANICTKCGNVVYFDVDGNIVGKEMLDVRV